MRLDFRLETLPRWSQSFLWQQWLHRQTHLDLLIGLLTELLLELLHGHAHILQILLQLEALLRNAVLEVLYQLIHAAFDHGVGNFSLHTGDNLVNQVVLNLLVGLLLLVGGNALADGILQLIQRIVLADVLGKVIISSGSSLY